MESEPARAALAAFREATRCSPELRDDNLRAIEARLHEVTPLRRPGPIVRTAVIVAALAAAAIAVWMAGIAPDEAIARRDDVREQAVDAAPRDDADQRAQQRVARPPVAIPEPPTPATAGTVADAPVTPTVQRSTRPAARVAVEEPSEPAAIAPPEDGFVREVQLMGELKREIGARHPLAARRALDALEREFPNGALVEERWALHVMMHCHAHAPDAAASTAAAFLRAHPRSSLAQQLTAVPCPPPKSR